MKSKGQICCQVDPRRIGVVGVIDRVTCSLVKGSVDVGKSPLWCINTKA